MKDPLELFGDLPDYPGKRVPKNRPEAKEVKHEDIFAGVPKKTYTVKGVPTDFYTVGATAKMLERTAQTLRRWEKCGWIPAASFRTQNSSGSELLNPKQKGYRLYSRGQVETLRDALMQSNLYGTRTPDWQNSANWVSFINYIKANWHK